MATQSSGAGFAEGGSLAGAELPSLKRSVLLVSFQLRLQFADSGLGSRAGLMLNVGAGLGGCAGLPLVVGASPSLLAGRFTIPPASSRRWYYLTIHVGPGKRALGLYVLTPDGSGAGLVRKFCRSECSTPLSGSHLVIAFRKDRRGIHDLICDTIVVRL